MDYQKVENLLHASLFSGVGGIDLACDWAGFETFLQCELPGWAFEVLRQRWPNVKRFTNVRDINERTLDDIPEISLLSGGFPCQSFSTSGKRKGKEDDRYLWDEMLRVIELVQPRWICAENVTGLTTIDEETFQVDDPEEEQVYAEKILSQILEDIEQAGYLLPRATTGEAIIPVIPAYSVGACHKRSRVFIFASHGEKTRSRELSICGGGPQQASKNFERSIGRSVNVDKDRCDYRTDRRKGILRNEARFEIGTSDQPLSYLESRQQSQWVHVSRNGWWTREQIEERSKDSWPEVATRFCRVDDDVPGRVDRIACLGNAVVPAQIYPIVKAIADYERMTMG
jgi:DNA (cytosine-5)-methyltransferase 1